MARVLPACGCSFFIFPTGWYAVCEQFLVWALNSGNPDLVCKETVFLISSKDHEAFNYFPYVLRANNEEDTYQN